METETLFSFAIGRLNDLLVKQAEFLQALRGPVDDLVKMLTKMEDLLEHSHVRRDKRAAEIIELADHLTYSIEKYILRVLSDNLGIRERLLRPKVCTGIEKVTTKINELVNSQSGEASSYSSGPRRAYKVQDLSGFNEKNFVGRENDINKLVSYLIDGRDEQFQVISIYGMGGLGKTTLARKVYRDKKVLSHFKSFAFICVSEECHTEEILKHILQQLVPEKKEEINGLNDDEDVVDWLKRVYRERRCLIIIDDIWSVRDWESLSRGLPDGCTGGSKVLLTTRIKYVAEKGFCHPLNCLSEDECWKLFHETIPTGQGPEVRHRMEMLGRKMLAWCHGIPLAILVLRGSLITKGSLREWERFYKSRTWGGKEYERFNGEVVEELLFSYKELPYPLKPCFLYLATFAEEKIAVEKLYRLWDAEGMILSKDREVGETMLDVAERYLGELVGRSMVEAKLEDEVLPNVRRRYKFCWLHNLMRGLCFSVVKKENFLKVHDYRGSGDKVVVLNLTCLRIDTKIPSRHALYFSRDQDFSVYGKQEANQHVSSLLFKNGGAKKLSNLKKLNLLRVLSLNRVSIGKEEFTDELIHLRYLSLKRCNLRKVPSCISNLIYLQSLDIRVYLPDREVLIQNLALRKLKSLKHLFLPKEDCYKVTPEFSKLRLDGLTELETLVNLDSSKCEIKDVFKLTNLKRLECKIRISSEDDYEELKRYMNMVNLDPSRHSWLAIVLDNPKMKIYSNVLRGKMPEYCDGILREMKIVGLTGRILPEFSNFNRLTVLRLEEFEVEEDPMTTLEKLSNLKELTLLSGKVNGKGMAFSEMGFPQLRHLNFSFLENWEKWRVEEGAMPNLVSLSICNCSKLKKLPYELTFITTLEYLRTEGMSEGFTRRLIRGAGEGGPEFFKIRSVRVVHIK